MSKFAQTLDKQLEEQNDNISDIYNQKTNDDKLFLRFLKTHDIAKKKNKFLNFKG
jgi:hypothetical protein